MKNLFSVEGKVVVVTGGSRGIGEMIAAGYLANGAKVYITSRKAEICNASAERLAEAWGGECISIPADMATIEGIEGFVSELSSREAHVDILVNNAGVGLSGPAELADMEATRLIFETNLFGYLRMARAVLPKMREQGEGQVFNVSSQLGRILIPNLSMYCATKFGVEAMFETMAYELAPFGVEVTIIQPGGYPTKIWDNGRQYSDAMLARAEEDRLEAYDAHIQMARGILNGEYSTDPNDVPRAIAEIMAMPPGTRPLRRPVHPNTAATDAANGAMAQIQASVLGGGAYKSWHDAVKD